MWSEEEHAGVLDGISRLGWLVLKRFSAAYRPSEILAAFAALSAADFDILRRLHFGLSAATAGFLRENSESFLRTAPTSTETVLEERVGSPRGRIDWQRTVVRRAQVGEDPTRFITRPIERTMDSPPARLVAYMLKRIAENADHLLKRNVPEIAVLQLTEDAAIARRRLAVLRGRGVRIPNKLVGREVASLRRSRHPDVTAAVLLFDLYAGLIENASENLLRNLLRDSQWAPENPDDLFEIWTLLNFVDSHLREGWNLDDARLIGGDKGPKKPKFTLTRGPDVADIYYQTVPDEMAKASAYKEIFRDYDLDATLRRPDITVEVSFPERKQRMFVEVKRTSDPSYILDSVYKTLGYLADFKQTIGPNAPHAILVVWDGINLKNAPPPAAVIRIANANDFVAMALPY